MLSTWPQLGSEIEQVFAYCGSAPHYAGRFIYIGAYMRFGFFQELEIRWGGQWGSGLHHECLELQLLAILFYAEVWLYSKVRCSISSKYIFSMVDICRNWKVRAQAELSSSIISCRVISLFTTLPYYVLSAVWRFTLNIFPRSLHKNLSGSIACQRDY